MYREGKIIRDLKKTYGNKWVKELAHRNTLSEKLDFECIERIEADLRTLSPLSVAFKKQGITDERFEEFLKLSKLRQPWIYILERFNTARAEAEINILKKLDDPDITQKNINKLKWKLERCLDDTYSPRTKSTKTVTETKQVNVKMSLDRSIIKQPQLQPVAPIPTVTKIMEAEVISAVPELIEKSN